MRLRTKLLGLLVVACAFALPLGPGGAPAHGSPLGPSTALHYTANGNFDPSGAYTPGGLGFNIADVSSPALLADLPAHVQALAYVGTCNGADATFRATVDAYRGLPNLFGFYLMDDADPTGRFGPLCTAANLAAESDYVHTTLPGARTFVLLMNLSASTSPSFAGGYTPANSHVDLFGVDPYPCRTELHGCDLDMIRRYVTSAQGSGVPVADMVPVYQTFGLGGWADDGGGRYAVPSAAEMQQMLAVWATLVARPVFDYAYSWGVQRDDQALSGLPAVQRIVAQHNILGAPRSPERAT
ncbi:hypothetical protein [Streptacidiphilus jiangxiensis]|uniref:Spherulation-specific family 4 n=1 Tax=Streptacidiphilus jiangxiensis TaxID=235985 RepID=A0A1H7QJV4_STRJI|nr:hypothetical protein [Streptacidiphilus jiangxiensis]SEL48401.1 hypothetical protein SAMN05414137_10974 [Streptacidiphilus jiangxiensis]